MLFRNCLFLLFFPSLLISCSHTKRTDKQIENAAKTVIQRLDSVTLNFFREWDYSQRGPSGFWMKLSGDSSLYSWRYTLSKDTVKIDIYRPKNFLNDFTNGYTVDSSFEQIQLIQLNDSLFNLEGSYGSVHNTKIASVLSTSNFFSKQDPFILFKQLTSLKDSLWLIGTSYNSPFDGFIQFYLSPEHVLTYIPDSTTANIRNKEFWQRVFINSKMINKYWNLRKLEGPIGGG